MKGDYLFVQPFLHPPGGGEGVANWMIQILASRGNLTVLTWEPEDFQPIDEYYGTELRRLPFQQRTVVPPWLSGALKATGLPLETLKLCLLMATAKRWRHRFRHCLSAFNDLDLGGGAVQYIHFPSGDFRDLRKLGMAGALSQLAWPVYLETCRRLAGWTPEGVRSNVTLANSSWTAGHYLGKYGAPVHGILFPPALGSPDLPSLPREEAFLSIGRVTRSKEWPRLITIIERVRAQGHDVGLTLAGSRADEGLLSQLLALIEPRKQWLRLELDCPREKMDHLIASHKYGLHGMMGEHYGMAVAELVLGGCLTLVHDSGGQTEIVSQAQARYSDVDDAVAKIAGLLGNPKLQQKIAAEQAQSRSRFTRQSFIDSFQSFLDNLEAGRLQPLPMEA